MSDNNVRCEHCSRMPFAGHHAACPNNADNLAKAKKARITAAMTKLGEAVTADAQADALAHLDDGRPSAVVEVAFLQGARRGVELMDAVLKEMMS